MTPIRSLLVVLGIIAGSMFVSSEARAENHRHHDRRGHREPDRGQGVVTINNPTSSNITYKFRWGENGAWLTYSLAPGTSRWHGYPLDRDGNAVTPYIRFDDKLYNLEFYAADDPDVSNGRPYSFGFPNSLDLTAD